MMPKQLQKYWARCTLVSAQVCTIIHGRQSSSPRMSSLPQHLRPNSVSCRYPSSGLFLGTRRQVCLNPHRTFMRDTCCRLVVILCGRPSQVMNSWPIDAMVSELGTLASSFPRMVVSMSFSTYAYHRITPFTKLLAFPTISST